MNLENATDAVKDFNSNTNGLVLSGLGGGAAGAGISSYLASRKKNQHESPEDRRRRIMLSTLVGGGLGAATTTAVPAGIKMLSEGYEPGVLEGAGNAAAQGGVLAAGAGLGALGGAGASKRWLADSAGQKQQALDVITQLKKDNVSGLGKLLGSGGASGSFDDAALNISNRLSDPRSGWQDHSFLDEIRGKVPGEALDPNKTDAIAKRLLAAGGLDKNVDLVSKGKNLLGYLKAVGPKNYFARSSFLRPQIFRGAGRAGMIGGLGALGLAGASRFNDAFVRN